MRHFKNKIDAGANVIFTQMFYDADGERVMTWVLTTS